MHCNARKTIRLMNKSLTTHTHQLGEAAYQTIIGRLENAVNYSTESMKLLCFSCAVLHRFD